MAAVTANITRYTTKSGIRYRVRITNRNLRSVANHFNQAGFVTRREAEAYARSARDKLSAINRDDLDITHTLSELIESYKRHRLPLLNAKDQRSRVGQLERWKGQLGAETLLVDISPKKIAAGLREFGDQPVQSAPRGKRQPPDPSAKRISNSTLNRLRAALSAVFTYACKDLYWSNHNPVHDTHLAKEPQGRIRWLEPNEIQRLSTAIDTKHGHLPMMYWLALTTGARLGEIQTATWDQVVFMNDGSALLSLPTSKNGEPRVLPIALPKVVHLLKRQRLRYSGTHTAIIPPDRPGARHYRWRIAWREALIAAGIENFHFHDLRHTFASHLAMSGHDGLQIADLTGHKSLAMVKRYAHLNSRTRKQNAALALEHMGLR